MSSADDGDPYAIRTTASLIALVTLCYLLEPRRDNRRRTDFARHFRPSNTVLLADSDRGRAFVHEVAETAERGRIGVREDAVTKVEDVAGPSAGSVEDRLRRRLHPLPRTEEQRGVEVPLHAPVVADHVSAGRGHRLQQVRRARPEVDRGRGDAAENPLRIGRDELLIVVDAECADPAVEELDRVGAGLDLRADVAEERLAQP